MRTARSDLLKLLTIDHKRFQQIATVSNMKHRTRSRYQPCPFFHRVVENYRSLLRSRNSPFIRSTPMEVAFAVFRSKGKIGLCSPEILKPNGPSRELKRRTGIFGLRIVNIFVVSYFRS